MISVYQCSQNDIYTFHLFPSWKKFLKERFFDHFYHPDVFLMRPKLSFFLVQSFHQEKLDRDKMCFTPGKNKINHLFSHNCNISWSDKLPPVLQQFVSLFCMTCHVAETLVGVFLNLCCHSTPKTATVPDTMSRDGIFLYLYGFPYFPTWSMTYVICVNLVRDHWKDLLPTKKKL